MNEPDCLIKIIEYDPQNKEFIFYLDDRGLENFREDIELLRDMYDHTELCGSADLTEKQINKNNEYIEWFQFNHLKTPEGWSHLLWCDSSGTCCLDNAGVDILLKKLDDLKKPGVFEVLLKDGLELSSPDSAIEGNYELVKSIKIIKIDENVALFTPAIVEKRMQERQGSASLISRMLKKFFGR